MTIRVPLDLRYATERCVLRYPVLGDAARILSAFRSPTFPRDVPLGRCTSPEQVRQWIEGSQSRWTRGQGYTWAVERKGDGTLVGQVTLTRMPDPNTWALAYWTHPDCSGHGYATEAARGVLEYAFEKLGAARVWAGATPWNQGSLRVLAKLGMIHMGDNPAGYEMDNKPVPTREFEITASMWKDTMGSTKADS